MRLSVQTDLPNQTVFELTGNGEASIGRQIRLGNGQLLYVTAEDARIMIPVLQSIIDDAADVAHPLPDFPADVPASLVEAQEVDE